MFVERQRLVERVVELDRGRSTAERDAAEARAELAEARAELTRLAEHGEVLTAQVAERDRELRAWRNTKLVRWTDPMRRAYGKMLGQ
jgi:chromosome segregation ATPase